MGGHLHRPSPWFVTDLPGLCCRGMWGRFLCTGIFMTTMVSSRYSGKSSSTLAKTQPHAMLSNSTNLETLPGMASGEVIRRYFEDEDRNTS